MRFFIDSHSEDPPDEDACSAHGNLKPCAECRAVNDDFLFDQRRDEEMMRQIEREILGP